MNKQRICILPGDGIGPEVMNQAVKVLNTIKSEMKLDIETNEKKIGGAAIEEFGTPLPKDTLQTCLGSDAVLLGSIGGPKWDNLPPEKRPETGGLLELRKQLKLYANIRPVKIFNSLEKISPLKENILKRGIDLVTIRELSGGIYFGEPSNLDERIGYDTMIYRREEIERICEIAFKTASNRRKKVCSVDKSNVLKSSRLWNKVVSEVSMDFSDIKLEHMYVDNAAMQLILNPSDFDVILTSNLFGDILSDESAALLGSLGMLPSASLGETVNLFEPAGGSAPGIAGKNIANPTAQILSLAMLFEYSLKNSRASKIVQTAVENVIHNGIRTLDIREADKEPVSTDEFGDLVCKEIKNFCLS